MHIGQEVVCVDAAPRGEGPTGLVEGNIYVIEDVRTNYQGTGFTLKGVDIRPGHCAFFADRFRPVAKKSTSIEVFHEMLRSNELVDAV